MAEQLEQEKQKLKKDGLPLPLPKKGGAGKNLGKERPEREKPEKRTCMMLFALYGFTLYGFCIETAQTVATGLIPIAFFLKTFYSTP